MDKYKLLYATIGKYGASYMKKAALASATSESIKYYEKDKKNTEEEFVHWYVDSVFEDPKMCKYMELIKVTRGDLEVACQEGIEESKVKMLKSEQSTEQYIKGNDPCYCGSGKKYKKCCGK